ncbi:MAG: NUDIX domain-containing protein [Candidatus Taylorbacteria bacterium]|nr:NUDIX domain-containing protein [Candidatus Taylorbacteria bacterium]
MQTIIVKAMLVVRNGNKLLFSRGFDTGKKEAFLRPLGGHMEFGEIGAETVRREMQEEVGCDVLDVKFISAVENLFTYNGKQGHEIILMYEGKLADESLYRKDKFMFMEGKRETEAGWYSKADVAKENIPIFPPFNYF